MSGTLPPVGVVTEIRSRSRLETRSSGRKRTRTSTSLPSSSTLATASPPKARLIVVPTWAAVRPYWAARLRSTRMRYSGSPSSREMRASATVSTESITFFTCSARRLPASRSKPRTETVSPPVVPPPMGPKLVKRTVAPGTPASRGRRASVICLSVRLRWPRSTRLNRMLAVLEPTVLNIIPELPMLIRAVFFSGTFSSMIR